MARRHLANSIRSGAGCIHDMRASTLIVTPLISSMATTPDRRPTESRKKFRHATVIQGTPSDVCEGMHERQIVSGIVELTVRVLYGAKQAVAVQLRHASKSLFTRDLLARRNAGRERCTHGVNAAMRDSSSLSLSLPAADLPFRNGRRYKFAIGLFKKGLHTRSRFICDYPALRRRK